MKSWKPIVISGGIAIAALLIWYATVPQPIPVDVAEVTVGQIRTFIEERGKTRLPHITRITMPSSGRIHPRPINEGEAISRDDIVARIDQFDLDTDVNEGQARVDQLAAKITENDDTRLEENALAQSDTLLTSMDRAVEAAMAQTRSSLARQQFADSELKRVKNLAERNAATESEVDEAELFRIESGIDYQKDVLTWRAIQALHAGMKIGRNTIEKYIEKKALQRAVLLKEQAEAEAQLRALERRRERGTLRSPVEGVVLKRFISNERVLSAGEALLDIGRLQDLEVEVDVLTQDAAGIAIGDQVDISGHAIGERSVPGRVTRIYPQGFTKVSSLGVEQQRVLVIVAFEKGVPEQLRERGRTLGSDYRVRVKITTDSASGALVVPRSALFRGPLGDWQLFAVRGSRAILTDVKVGLKNDEEVQILSGIEAETQVVLIPESDLATGTRVAPRLRKTR